LHDCYIEGKYVEKDIAKALSYLEEAVEGEFSTACFMKGCHLFDGDYGVTMDKEEAVRLWTIAGRKGHTSAAFNLGLCYRDGKGAEQNVSTAIFWLEKAAEDDYEKAIMNLVDIYLLGKGGADVDYDKGISWLEKAADLGTTDAFFKLGVYYFHGEYGCIQSIEKALEYWKRGSDAGHSGCTKNIGLCYKNGEGVPQNFTEAISWFEKAMGQGSIDAMLELGLAYDDNGLTTPDYAKAVGYYAEAYSAGSAHGAYCLGTMYEHGHGVAEDMTKAFELYKYAGEHGHARGMAKTGIFYHDGLGTEKDIAKAVECFEAAKAMGDSDADNLLAFVYGKGAPDKDGTDPKKAFEFNLNRAQEGDPEAQYQVYQAYEKGIGVSECRGGLTLLQWASRMLKHLVQMLSEFASSQFFVPRYLQLFRFVCAVPSDGWVLLFPILHVCLLEQTIHASCLQLHFLALFFWLAWIPLHETLALWKFR